MQQYQPKLILPSLQAAALTWTPQRSVSEQKELILELTLSLWWLYSHKHLGGRLRGRGDGERIY